MEKLRRSVIAGSWYPKDASTLRIEILECLSRVPDLEDRMIGLLAPHAGYMHSGQVDAHAYKQVCGKMHDAVILSGPSRKVAFSGVSIYSRRTHETPLDIVPVAALLAAELEEGDPTIVDYPNAHVQEHSLEIQFPFFTGGACVVFLCAAGHGGSKFRNL